MLTVIVVEVYPLQGLRFVPTSFFPNISLTDILELEFDLSYAMQIPFDWDQKEFFEFIWFYERLTSQKKREREAEQKQNSGTQNLGQNNGM